MWTQESLCFRFVVESFAILTASLIMCASQSTMNIKKMLRTKWQNNNISYRWHLVIYTSPNVRIEYTICQPLIVSFIIFCIHTSRTLASTELQINGNENRNCICRLCHFDREIHFASLISLFTDRCFGCVIDVREEMRIMLTLHCADDEDTVGSYARTHAPRQTITVGNDSGISAQLVSFSFFCLESNFNSNRFSCRHCHSSEMNEMFAEREIIAMKCCCQIWTLEEPRPQRQDCHSHTQRECTGTLEPRLHKPP